MGKLTDAIDYNGVRDRLRHQKPMQFVPALKVAAGGLEKYGFKTLREFVTAHTSDGGLGVPLDKAKWLIEFNPAYKHQAKELIAKLGIGALVETVPAVQAHGGQLPKKGCDISENITSPDRGTSAKYRIAKLKRDHPEVAERLAAGEFKTVAEAERAAGIKPALRPLVRLTLPLDDEEEARKLFEDWLKKTFNHD
jgi:hypothetical protein